MAGKDDSVRTDIIAIGRQIATGTYVPEQAPAVAQALDKAATKPADGATELQAIPDYPGAETGLNGVKAPFSYRQEDDIRDRLVGAGVIKHDQI